MGRKIMSAEDKLTIERLYQTTSDAIIGEIIGKSRGYGIQIPPQTRAAKGDTLYPIVSPRNNKEPGTPATQTDGTCPVAKKTVINEVVNEYQRRSTSHCQGKGQQS